MNSKRDSGSAGNRIDITSDSELAITHEDPDSALINIDEMSEIKTFNLETAHEHIPDGIITYRRAVG